MSRNDLKYIENILHQNDRFCSGEIVLDEQTKDKYIQFSDFGLNESDIVYITDDSSELFKESAESLKAAELIGIDSEFVMTYTKFDQSGVSIL